MTVPNTSARSAPGSSPPEANCAVPDVTQPSTTECVNRGWKEPEEPCGRNHEPSTNTDPTTLHQTPPRRRFPKERGRARERTTTLVKEGQLSKACFSLLDEPLAPSSESVAKEMRDRHPPSYVENVARLKLLPVAPVSLATTHSLPPVQDAILLRQTRPQDCRVSARNTSGEASSQRHHGEGPYPGPTVSWSASAMFTAWKKKKDGGYRPEALKGTVRRLTAKACWSVCPWR